MTPKEINFKDIKVGDTIRTVQILDDGTILTAEGTVNNICHSNNHLYFGQLNGCHSHSIANYMVPNRSSLPTFYLLHRPPEESPIHLLRTLPMGSLVEVHVEVPYEHENYILRGNLKRRIEDEEPEGFRYEISGKYTGTKGTVMDKMLLRVPEKRIRKLFILPSPSPDNKAECTS